MVIRGEVQIDVFTFSFTIHGSRGDWKLTISAPGFPFGSVTTEQETKEPTWFPAFNGMLSDAYAAACRRSFPGREIATEVRRCD